MPAKSIFGFDSHYSFSLPLWKQLTFTLGGVLLALIAAAILRIFVSNASLLPFIAAVALGAYLGGVRGAVLSAVVGYLLVEYFFVEPVGMLFPEPILWLRAILFVAVAAFIGWLQQQWHLTWKGLTSTHEELESILASAADGIVVLDDSLNILYANPQAQQLLGLPAAFSAGKPLLPQLDELQFCDELEAALTSDQLPFRKTLTTGMLNESVFGCGAKDGPINRWINVRAAPLLDDKGRVKSIIAIFTDHSVQRHLLRKVQDERDRLHSIFEVMSDAVIVSDEDGALRMLNASAEKLLGITPGAARGHMMTEVYTFEPAAAARIALTDVTVEAERIIRPLPPGTLVQAASGERVPVSGSVIVLPGQMGKVTILKDIREQALLERLRAQSEQHLRDMLNNLICVVVLAGPDGQILEYNRGHVAQGQTETDPARPLQSDDILAVWRSGDVPPVLVDAFERALQGETMRFDLALPAPDSDTRFFDVQAGPLHNETGQVDKVVFSAIDITDRKQAQQTAVALTALISRERKRLEDIVEGIPAIIWESAGRPGTNHRITFSNNYAEELLGLPLQEWLNRSHPWESIMHPDDRDAAIAQMQAHFDNPTDSLSEPVQFRILKGTDAVLTLEMRVSAVQDDEGHSIGMRGVALDITQQKDAEQHIKQLMQVVEVSRRRLQETIDTVPAVIWEARGAPPESKLVFVSNYAETLSGYTASEWIESPEMINARIMPEDINQAATISVAGHRDGTIAPVHLRMRHKQGHMLWLVSNVSEVQDASGQAIGVRGVTTDVSALHQIEAELRRSNEELQQFAYVASHDLQEPLRMVTSYLQLIEQRYAGQLDEQAHEFIDFAVGGAARMKQLITGLLAYSRLQTSRSEFQQVDLNALVGNVLQNLDIQIKDAAALVECDPLPSLSGNPMLLTQLFQNLITNALKFRRAEPPHVEVRVQRVGPMWQFAVRDSGIGFDARYASRVFVLFQRLHSQAKYPGTGIGLTICRKVVEIHAGEIWVESQVGQGTTFYFTLPAQSAGETTDAG